MKGLMMKYLSVIVIASVVALAALLSIQSSKLPLRILRDVQLSGASSRLDYQSLDSGSGRLYIAHLGDNMMTVFDTNTERVIGDVRGLSHVHGVLAVPELHRVYATATGTNELAVIDDQKLSVEARVPAADYPDGVAFASKAMKVYVFEQHGA